VNQRRSLYIDVRGLPRPQGSMRAFPNGGMSYPPAVWDWRHQVQQVAADAIKSEDGPILGPVELRLGFDLPRLLSHYGTGRNAGALKASAPLYPTVTPDLDKLVRAVCDALTDAGVWRDDSQVAVLAAAKRYGEHPGVMIHLDELENT
jgi:crossover junction endodeoxyribonuclease RusA